MWPLRTRLLPPASLLRVGRSAAGGRRSRVPAARAAFRPAARRRARRGRWSRRAAPAAARAAPAAHARREPGRRPTWRWCRAGTRSAASSTISSRRSRMPSTTRCSSGVRARSSEEVALPRHHELRGRCRRRATSTPRTTAAGTPRVLPITSSAAPAISSATAIRVERELVPGRVDARRSARGSARSRRRRARRRSSPAARRGRTSRSRRRRRRRPVSSREPLAEARRRGVGVERAAGRACPRPGAFDASTPAEAQTNPCRVSAITSGGRERTTVARLAQDPLDLARVALVAGELERALGGLDVVERDDAALDLRDGLLRDHDDVASLEPADAAPRPRAGAAAEVVALVELRQAGERDDAQRRRRRRGASLTVRRPRAQCRPVTRRPACAL